MCQLERSQVKALGERERREEICELMARQSELPQLDDAVEGALVRLRHQAAGEAGFVAAVLGDPALVEKIARRAALRFFRQGP